MNRVNSQSTSKAGLDQLRPFVKPDDIAEHRKIAHRQVPEVPRLVNPREAAEILGRASSTLKRWRYEGVGPAYVEIEGRVSYDLSVLVDFINANTRVPSVRAYMEESREAL